MAMPNIVLASSSKARYALLKRVLNEFIVQPADIDETPLQNESSDDLVARLTKEKAYAVAGRFNNHYIISSDQVIIINGEICSKPEIYEVAVRQLQAASGNWVKSLTGLGLLNTQNGHYHYACIQTEVLFRHLTIEEIHDYLAKDQPLNCAGSLRVEALGIVLLEKIVSDDPTALIGLPLIQLTNFMKREGFSFLSSDALWEGL